VRSARKSDSGSSHKARGARKVSVARSATRVSVPKSAGEDFAAHLHEHSTEGEGSIAGELLNSKHGGGAVVGEQRVIAITRGELWKSVCETLRTTAPTFGSKQPCTS
jgi:hypothetical protein